MTSSCPALCTQMFVSDCFSCQMPSRCIITLYHEMYHHILSRTVSSHPITNPIISNVKCHHTVSSHSTTNCIVTLYHEPYHKTLSSHSIIILYHTNSNITLYHHTASSHCSTNSINTVYHELYHNTLSSHSRFLALRPARRSCPPPSAPSWAPALLRQQGPPLRAPLVRFLKSQLLLQGYALWCVW